MFLQNNHQNLKINLGEKEKLHNFTLALGNWKEAKQIFDVSETKFALTNQVYPFCHKNLFYFSFPFFILIT